MADGEENIHDREHIDDAETATARLSKDIVNQDLKAESSTKHSNGDGIYNDEDVVYPDYSQDLEKLQSIREQRQLQQDQSTKPPSLIRRTKSTAILNVIFPHTPSKDPDGPPPDGGILAWSQVLAAHLAVFNAWGYITSFGVFQPYYQTVLNRSPSDVSWIGSIQIWLLFFVGAFSGRMTDAGHFATVFIAGSVLILVGVFMTSLATQYWHVLLAQGVCQGLGFGLSFCPQLAVIATYFQRNRALALALAASGTATGGMVYPAIVECLLPKIDFAWTVRVIGFVMLVLQLVALTLFKPRLAPRKTGPILELTAFLEAPYVLFAVGMFLVFWGFFFAFYYVGSFGTRVIGLSHEQSINLLLTMNGVGLPSRIIPAIVADRFSGPLNLHCVACIIASIVLFCWIAISSTAGLTAFSVVYGMFSAAIIGLFPATLSSLTADLKKMGVRMGMVFSIVSFACLTGNPIAGVLIQRNEGGFLYAQAFAGSSVLVGTLLLIASRITKVGWKIKVRA